MLEETGLKKEGSKKGRFVPVIGMCRSAFVSPLKGNNLARRRSREGVSIITLADGEGR